MSSEVFSRERLAGYDPNIMQDSCALIVGCGALGQNTAINMALSGVGELRLVDKDVFEEHNRSRSPAFPLPEEQAVLGLKKAPAVAHKIKKMMTAATPKMLFAHAWVEELGDGAFAGVSVVVSCVDRPAARAYLADRSRLHGIPLIEAGFDGPALTLSRYPATTAETARTVPCWRCSHQEVEGAFSCRFYAEKAESLGIIPALQNSAATLAGLQSEAAIETLHGRAQAEATAFDLDIRTGNSRRVRLSLDPECPGLHHTFTAPPIELNSGPESTVEDLLTELSDHLASTTVRIVLPEPLVWEAPCTKTGKMAAVHAPYSVWRSEPTCTDAGGRFLPIQSSHNASPLILLDLDANMPREIKTTFCKVVGLPALSIAQVEMADELHAFRLGGSIADLFEEVK